MNTHDLAKALRALAALLEHSPSIPLNDLRLSSKDASGLTTGQMAVSLSTLAELSRVDKQQWIAFIRDLGFDLDVRPRDASRDILGKLLSYLESNAPARDRLKTKAAARGSQASPELMKALSSLLKDAL